MFLDTAVWIRALMAIAFGFAISFASTPIAKMFAQKVGAIDVPTEARRVHNTPIPRMGGLAIFLGFAECILFVDITRQVRGILLGAVVIVACGAIDDVVSLRAWVKFLVQIAAAVIAVLHGVVIEVLRNPYILNREEAVILGALAVPFTILWIVGITNSVNLIDGLDGLAVGVSIISSVTMFVVALLVSAGNVAVILAALTGACLGFMPYNLNPAKIFMGDTGALLLGYVLATVSVVGMFKFYCRGHLCGPIMALALTAFRYDLRHPAPSAQGPEPNEAGSRPPASPAHRTWPFPRSRQSPSLFASSAILGLCAVVLASSHGEHVASVLALWRLWRLRVYIRKTLKGHEYHPPRKPRRRQKKDVTP
jgi:UDP-GlcNAc:undecaprenyl-phosphate GlcNAc-1-phosphate transferase